MTNRMGGQVLSAVLASLLVVATLPGEAHADNNVKPDGKGTVGLGLIGLELGFVIPALAGAEGTWPYIVFPIVGGAGGAAAGYFGVEKSGSTAASVAMLGIGLAGLIPALVATLSLTSYQPEDEDSAPQALLRLNAGQLALGVPLPSVSDSYTDEEKFQYGVSSQMELSLALLSGAF